MQLTSQTPPSDESYSWCLLFNSFTFVRSGPSMPIASSLVCFDLCKCAMQIVSGAQWKHAVNILARDAGR